MYLFEESISIVALLVHFMFTVNQIFPTWANYIPNHEYVISTWIPVVRTIHNRISQFFVAFEKVSNAFSNLILSMVIDSNCKDLIMFMQFFWGLL